jgi:polysaccharide biosynthesis/export protein VpsN
MNILRMQPKNAVLFLGLCGIAALLAGCESARTDDPYFSEVPGITAPLVGGPVAVAPVGLPVRGTNPAEVVGRPRVGDTVTITFSGLDPSNQLPPHEERIKDDGTITLYLINSVVAAGKTSGELQREIQEKYRKYYPNLVVTVKVPDLFFSVGGEVRNPNKQPWTGEVTVTRAIQASGDFTDFANKKKVLLTRVDGTVIKVNCIEALENPQLDPKVMPGDKITVPRKWY